MEMPYWCTVLVHQYGQMATRNQEKRLEFTFSIKVLSFHWETSIPAHKHTLEMVILLRIKRRDFFHRDSITILVSRTLKTQKFKLQYFRNETGCALNLNKLNLFEIDLFIKMPYGVWSSLQPDLETNKSSRRMQVSLQPGTMTGRRSESRNI